MAAVRRPRTRLGPRKDLTGANRSTCERPIRDAYNQAMRDARGWEKVADLLPAAGHRRMRQHGHPIERDRRQAAVPLGLVRHGLKALA